eukprot:CAMPEP_0180478364 /NCGR_PEP_ID=MMETSP1036_2-20121128/32741_1 /TAXON_ID=632150 /ORGANISM="Azadinium spinosum, Strain 3D9" /LENGTH=48 /DNA_ID= /DNA_START= /DNA_END= /DNA_ORIENTATION=
MKSTTKARNRDTAPAERRGWVADACVSASASEKIMSGPPLTPFAVQTP